MKMGTITIRGEQTSQIKTRVTISAVRESEWQVKNETVSLIERPTINQRSFDDKKELNSNLEKAVEVCY